VTCIYTGFIDIFSKRATGFHRQAKHYEPNFFIRKTFLQMVKPGGQIILTAGRFAQCLASNETPAYNSL